MHDFPPRIDAYTRAETARPDTRSPARFLLWTLRVQSDVLAAFAAASLAMASGEQPLRILKDRKSVV